MRSAQANEANEPQEEEERTEPANVVQQVLTIRIYFMLIKVDFEFATDCSRKANLTKSNIFRFITYSPVYLIYFYTTMVS
jgi:hypothetical protein